MPVLILVAGVCTGIIAAEFVRRRYGLINFWSGMQASKDADSFPGDED
ncbi:MAG: hypothetical protein JST86_08460 [Bacteroidetes bacterium]|nr:hypothetical protein [Bacteroidota bacterium]